MKQEIIKSELEVNDNKIKVITIDNKELETLNKSLIETKWIMAI